MGTASGCCHDNGTGDGVLAIHQQVFGPDIAITPGSENVYLTFVGGDGGNGAQNAVSTGGNGNATNAPGFGYSALHIPTIFYHYLTSR